MAKKRFIYIAVLSLVLFVVIIKTYIGNNVNQINNVKKAIHKLEYSNYEYTKSYYSKFGDGSQQLLYVWNGKRICKPYQEHIYLNYELSNSEIVNNYPIVEQYFFASEKNIIHSLSKVNPTFTENNLEKWKEDIGETAPQLLPDFRNLSFESIHEDSFCGDDIDVYKFIYTYSPKDNVDEIISNVPVEIYVSKQNPIILRIIIDYAESFYFSNLNEQIRCSNGNDDNFKNDAELKGIMIIIDIKNHDKKFSIPIPLIEKKEVS